MRMKKFAVMALATALSVGSVMTASAAWLQDGGNWRYQNDNGTFQMGTWFQDVDGKWYHFDNNGNMQKGWFLDADGKWYFMAYHGAMQTGLIRVDNAVYFMNPSGDLFIGEKAINGVTYNFGLYGTTNGTPSVGQSATFGGNGNQSSGGSTSSTRDVDPKPDVSGSATVANQEELDKALEKGMKSVTFKTDAKDAEVSIEGNYSSTTFTVDAPYATITNSAKFDNIVIKAIGQDTWIENGSGNTIDLMGSAHIENNGGPLKVNVAKASINVKLSGESDTPITLNVNKSNATVTAESPVTANVKAPVVLAVASKAVTGSSVNVPQAVEGAIKIRSLGTSGDNQLNVNVNAKANVETAIPAKILVGTESTVNVAVTSSAAAKGVSIKATSEAYDTAVDKVANEVKNQTSVEVEVGVEKSDGSNTEVKKENTLTVKDVIDANVQLAVDSAKASQYINNATKNEDEITVQVTSNATLLEAEGAAKAIYEMFLCPEVTEISIDSIPIESNEDLRTVAINLKLKGSDAVKEASKVDQVTVIITSSEGDDIPYYVNIK